MRGIAHGYLGSSSSRRNDRYLAKGIDLNHLSDAHRGTPMVANGIIKEMEPQINADNSIHPVLSAFIGVYRWFILVWFGFEWSSFNGDV